MVKIVKLQNNVEIIGNINTVDSEKVIIDNPFTINYMLSPRSDRPVVGLLRYLPFAEHRDVEFKMSDVLHVVDARQPMSRYYNAVLANHLNDIDETIDHELNQIADIESDAQSVETVPDDALTAMFERMNSNKNIH